MNKLNKAGCLFLSMVLLGPAVAAAKSLPAAKAVVTLENLIIAFNSAANAQARYLEFAKKADAEGYLLVSKLFKAVAMSKGIHAAQHAKTITALQAEPNAAILSTKVGSTRENLESALAEETEETEKMFPEFIKQAELEKAKNAARAFGGDKGIAEIHINWFKQALADLSQWRGEGEFYTCKVCGNVVAKLDFAYCPICKAPVSKFAQAM